MTDRKTNWRLRVVDGNDARLEFPAISADRVRVSVLKWARGMSSDVQLNYEGVSLASRRSYVLRFRGRAEKRRPMVVGVAQDHEPWSGLGVLQPMELTPEWQSYELLFEATADETKGRIHFDVGESDIPFELGDIQLFQQIFRIGSMPKLSYIICATPRCGSNLLSQALWCQNKAGRPQEYFLYWYALTHESSHLKAEAVQEWLLPTAAYVRKVIQQGTTPNGIFGFKVMWHHFEGVINRLRALSHRSGFSSAEILTSVFPNLHYIHVVRQDKARQAVSLVKAMQSGQWYETKRHQSAEAELLQRGLDRIDFHAGAQLDRLKYDFDQIAGCYQMLLDQEACWEAYFDAAGIAPYRVIYEELHQAYEQTVSGVLEYLEIPPPYAIDRQKIGLKRQSDAISNVWTERFVAELEQQREKRP